MTSVKLIHLACVVLTLVFFSLRGVWMMNESSLLGNKAVRVLPHVIDTFLLASGLFMAVSLYPAFYTQPWLQAKLLGVVFYIIAGSIALKYGKTKIIRTSALLAALCIFIYLVMVARTHSPLPFN